MKLVYSLSAFALTGALASPATRNHVSLRHSKREVNGSYIPTTAPRANIFKGISADETESIQEFMEKQRNKTIPGDMEFGDYISTWLWLLAPDKADATSYLAGNGSQPARYARAVGTVSGPPCYAREYVVGPLPVSNRTKVSPLDYADNGNATMDCNFGAMEGDFGGTESEGSAKLKRKLQRRSNLNRRSPHDPREEKLGWNQEKLPHDDKAPPVAILPDGARHEFDPEQNYVSWMDFSFYVSTGHAGLSLHDIRFKGERIVYELGMQEALAHYAGPDQMQTFASYLDVAIGFTEFSLIPGYDCPSYATYTDSFCLFEYPKDFPINRHKEPEYLHATKNIAFLLRSVSTVGNYDYQTTYEFYSDGSVQILVRASGYIQGSDITNGTEVWDYGFHIRDGLSGSMHDHVLNFKLDLDILGTENSLFKTEFVPHSQVYPWSNGQVVNSMKVERSFVDSEDQGKIDWAPNSAAAYAVVNKDKQNDLGEYPGFRISPSTGSSIHLTVENSTVFSNAVNWATHPMYALQRKDSEPVSAHPANDVNRQKPLVDFNNFFDGESLDQEDLVLYFNLGMHHMPDTYDLPNTVFTSAQSGITIRPQNYFHSENSMSTKQQIDITSGDNGEPKVETYGAKKYSGSYNLNQANPPYYPSPA